MNTCELEELDTPLQILTHRLSLFLVQAVPFIDRYNQRATLVDDVATDPGR